MVIIVKILRQTWEIDNNLVNTYGGLSLKCLTYVMWNSHNIPVS